MILLNGRAYKQNELLKNGKYPVLRVGNFNTNNNWYYSNLELDSKYYANKGDLLYTWSTILGPHIWQGSKIIYHYHIWKVVVLDKVDKLFIYRLLEKDKQRIMMQSVHGTTMTHITKMDMENKKFNVHLYPSSKRLEHFLKKLID